jgi:hypothetical protein
MSEIKTKTRNEPPPGPMPAPAPPQPIGPGDRTVQFEGTVQLFISDMPESSFVDLTDNGTHPVFACCWIDKDRGGTAHIVFPPGTGVGVFRIDLPMRDDDVNKVKLQLSMRMLDPATGNRRTVPLSTSCAHAGNMLTGQADQFRIPDQFIPGNFINVSMRVLNLADFADRPLRLRPSALDRIPEFNEHVRRVSKAIEDNNVLNSTVFVRGADSMRDGNSRFFLPTPFMALALALGTPAYTMLSCWQP